MSEFRERAWPLPEEFQERAYSAVLHGVGMCDEYPRFPPKYRGEMVYDGVLDAGMVVCLESYIGAVGGRDGVKLEQQALITEDGYERLSTFPYEAALMA